MDGAYWRLNRGVPDFPGEKLCHYGPIMKDFPAMTPVKVARMKDKIFMSGDTVGDGGNSGFQAFNRAILYGGTRFVLVGFDMRLDRGLHWHGKHKKGLGNPTAPNVTRWRKSFHDVAEGLRERGLAVYRESEASSLVAFPVLSLEKAIRLWGSNA